MSQRTRRGRPPKPTRLRRSRRLPLMLTPAEYAALNQYSTRHKVSASEVVRGCLKRFLEGEETKAASGGRQEKGGER